MDPFGGLMTVPYCAVPLKRRSISIELNPGYFKDGVAYVKAAEEKEAAPTLFDITEWAKRDEEEEIPESPERMPPTTALSESLTTQGQDGPDKKGEIT